MGGIIGRDSDKIVAEASTNIGCIEITAWVDG
jgi:hypothetical protein